MESLTIRYWQNWSGSVQCKPQQLLKPQTLDELIVAVKENNSAGRQIRVVGAGHSFTPLVQSDDLLISLEYLQGIEQVDQEGMRVTVLGGTTIKALGDLLLAQGLAQENLGDIDTQSIAGAISTGTHGTGISFGSLSTQVEGLTLITASGEVLECSATQHPEVFKAAQVSLGLLGIIAKVTLRVGPARPHHLLTRRENLDDMLDNLDELKRLNKHFEFYWFPHTQAVQAKYLNVTEEALTEQKSTFWNDVNRVVLENGVFWLLSETSRLAPQAARTVSSISSWGIATTEATDYSHRLFATPRAVRFQEMEYNIPAEELPLVLAELRNCISRYRIQVHFPVECRFVHADDIWLSPAYQRDSAYVAVHMYKGMPYEDYFRKAEAIFRGYEGRPHWGKFHYLSAEELASSYPRWEDFRRVRAKLDPQGLFLNTYLRQFFA
jgi:FAD-linked oxidoreductase